MSTRRRTPRLLPEYPLKTMRVSEDDYASDNLYKSALGGEDPATLDRLRRIKLQDEIIMLRVVMRKVAQMATEQDTPLDAWLDTMNSLSQAATRLARLLSVEQALAEGEENGLALLSRAIHETMKESAW